MPGGETSHLAMANRNHATMFFTVSPKPDLDDAGALAAYGRARAHLAAQRSAPAEAPGYRLFWVRGAEVAHKDIDETEYAVIGRHSACDVPLTQAAELSLRHLLIAPALIEGGLRGLRVLDLRASLPFYTDDGQPRRSILASGPVVLRLGTYLIGGVPIGPGIEHAHLPAEMPRAIVTHSSAAPPPDAAPLRETPRSSELSTIGAGDDDFLDAPLPANVAPTAPPVLGSHLSRVTVVPNAAMLTEVVRLDAPSAFARLTLLRESHSASLDLHASDLDAGVMIGRSERCTDGGLRRVLDGNISRIHVLLLREGDDVLLYDICSTQGTYDGTRIVRRHRFSMLNARAAGPRGGGCLSLAKTNPVMLCLHPRGSADGADTAPPDPVP